MNIAIRARMGGFCIRLAILGVIRHNSLGGPDGKRLLIKLSGYDKMIFEHCLKMNHRLKLRYGLILLPQHAL
jgi:hypothetical protein